MLQINNVVKTELGDFMVKFYEPRVGLFGRAPFNKNYPRSPLRYPGGKNRAIEKICSFIPDEEKVLCSPFIGGGSVELACSIRMDIRGYDVFSPLVDFWSELTADNERLADKVLSYYPVSKPRFYELQKNYLKLESSLDKAAAFYVLNRSSFSGTTLSGGMSPGHPRFTLSAIERLRKFKVNNFMVKLADFRESICDNTDAFLYLDPPYLNGQNLYGHKGDTHKGFNHDTLSKILHTRDRWIMSYNDCETVRGFYEGYTILPITWTYGMNKTKTSNEILILSHDLEGR